MSLRDFQDAYVDAMLWANTIGYDAETGEMVPVDMLQGGDTILLSEADRDAQLIQGAIDEMNADCSAFWDEMVTITNPDPDEVDPGTVDGEYHEPVWPAGYSDSQAGHDFALTRNGHGAGFWDRGLGELGELLTEAAKVWGGSELIVEGGEITLI